MEDSHNKKVKEFEQNIEELNANFSNLKMEKEKLIGIVDEQNLTLENLNANLVDLKKEKVSLEEHLTKEKENRKHTIISMQDKHSQFESEIQSILKTMLLGQGDELNVDELGNPVKILREKLNILLTTNNKLTTSGTELRSTITDLRNQITELRRSFEELKEECKNLARKNIESTIKIQSLEAEKLSEIEHLTRKFEAASQNNKTLLSEISSLQVNENTLLSKVKELSEEIEYHAATEVGLTSRISILEEKKLDLANAEVEILVLKNDNAKHVVEVKRLQENAIEMEDSLRKSQSVNVELLNQLDELKTTLTENAQRDTDYINLQLKYVSICAEKERLSEGKLKLEENCSKLTKRVENLSLKLGDLQATAAKLEKTNCESRAEIDSLQKVFNRNKKHSEELQTKLSIAQRDLKAAENKAANVQKSCEEETEKIQSMNQTIDELSLQLENKSLEINEQNAILIEMRSALKSKLATIAKANIEFTELKSKNDELEEQNQLLTAKVEKLVRLEDALKESQTAFDESLKSLKESQDFAENLQTENETLKAQIEEVNNCAENLKETTSHIDNIKHELELKVEKLSSSLENMSTALESAKVENVELKNKNSTLTFNLETLYEISSAVRVKSELPALSESTEDIDTKYHKIVQNVNQLNSNNQNLREINCSLAADLEASREENSKFCDNLSKLALKLQILENQNLEISNEMTTLRTSYDTLRVEKENLEKENLNSLATLNELETRQNEILHEHVISQDSFDEKVQQYAADVKEKSETIKELEAKLQEFKALEKVKAKELTTQNEQMVELEKKFESMENQIDREKDMNEKLRKDISIFQAKLFKNRQTTEDKEKKWLEEKNNLLTEIKIAEGRIKDNRLELEGKLEKMKNKMKSLYNDEVTKIRSKHDRDIFEYKTEVKELLVKNEKYESHVHKLAKQMFNLNETILELQKQNKFMETKLKDLESIPSSMLRRHSQFPSQLINSNLRMEDEEGELFNNTYLADLKNGRVSPFGRDSVSVQELQYRNSLAAPHLRSTYLAQYQDHNVREEDIKDMIPLNLDDSLSSLLHAGQRKKMSGTTSYKKPGPPTPSKNGGRLSFGGSNDTHPREILKDNNEQSICNTKKTTTPAKFRNMFSSSKVKDENTPPRRRLSNLFKSKK